MFPNFFALADSLLESPQPLQFCDTNTLYCFIPLSYLFWYISFAIELTKLLEGLIHLYSVSPTLAPLPMGLRSVHT